jgi:hypothetical protein
VICVELPNARKQEIDNDKSDKNIYFRKACGTKCKNSKIRVKTTSIPTKYHKIGYFKVYQRHKISKYDLKSSVHSPPIDLFLQKSNRYEKHKICANKNNNFYEKTAQKSQKITPKNTEQAKNVKKWKL